MKQYHVTKPDGSQCGPYDKATLFSLVKNNLVSPDSHVWCEGMAGWEPFKKVFAAKRNAPQQPIPQAFPSIQPAKKKGPWGLIIGILIAVLLITGSITGWLMMRNPITSDEDLLTFLQDNDREFFHVGSEDNKKRVAGILEELSSDSKAVGYRATKMSIIIMNSGDAAEYLLESRGAEQINADDMLEDALESGADKVAEALIKNGVSLEDDDAERMLGEIIDDAEWLHAPERSNENDLYNVSNFKKTRNYKRCAQLAVEKLKVSTKLSKRKNEDLKKLKLLGKEPEMVKYVESIIQKD